MLNIEPWGKGHLSPLSSLTFPCLIEPPPQLFLLLVGEAIGWQENHYYAHVCSHSPRRAFWQRTICPLWGWRVCPFSLMLGRVKRFHIPLFRGSHSLSQGISNLWLRPFHSHREPIFPWHEWTVYCPALPLEIVVAFSLLIPFSYFALLIGQGNVLGVHH